MGKKNGLDKSYGKSIRMTANLSHSKISRSYRLQMQSLFKGFQHHSIPSASIPTESPSIVKDTPTMAPDAQKWEYYPIKGVPVVKTSGSRRIVGVRQNIDEWSDNEANDKQVKLFVMALDRFQKIDPSKRESYFQVAGIS